MKLNYKLKQDEKGLWRIFNVKTGVMLMFTFYEYEDARDYLLIYDDIEYKDVQVIEKLQDAFQIAKNTRKLPEDDNKLFGVDNE